MAKTGATPGCEDGLFIEGRVGDVPVNFLVDTGANITIVKPSVFQRIANEARPPLQDPQTNMILADGSSLPFVGRAKVELQAGSLAVTHDIWVADIDLDAILGIDFLRKHRCELKLSDGQYHLSFPTGACPCQTRDSNPVCRRVAVSQTVVVPPRSEALVPAKVLGPPGEETCGVLEPASKFLARSSLLVARTVVDPRQETVYLRLLNPTERPRTVYKETVAAWCEPVQEEKFPDATKRVAVCEKSTEGQTTSAPESVPDHLGELLERSGRDLTADQTTAVAALLASFADVFSSTKGDIGRTGAVKHSIDTGDASPIRQRARRLPIHLRANAENEVQKMLSCGVIEPSSSPWASPVVLVKKKDGSTRFCVDYRKLNQVTVKDSYPLPRIDDSLDALAGAKWFSTLDLSSGYWQVEMADSDKEKTAFTTGTGLYQFTVMPFGLCNAPATFERLMEQVLAGMSWEVLLIYLDDVIIHAKSFQDQLDRLRAVFTRLRAAGLKLSPSKCYLFQQRVNFLGHIVSSDGVSTDQEKVTAVREWPTPTTATQVRAFLGLCSYYRRFVRGFADVAKPLYKLTEKGSQFAWSDECESAFKLLKAKLTSAPVLAYPTSEDPFILDTDASNQGVGAVLSQVHEGQERVVAYYSRSLTKEERNYCVTRKELLAVVAAVRHFHHYLYGRRFLIRSDHGALQWLLNFRNPEGQTARWLEELAMYEFEIQHRQGARHGNADALSRRPCTDCRKCERAEANDQRATPAGPQCAAAKTRAMADRTPPMPGPTQPGQWLNGLSTAELRKAQLADDNIAPLIRWKEVDQGRPDWAEVAPQSPTVKCYWAQWDRLTLIDGVLHRRWESVAGDKEHWQLLGPKDLKDAILREVHDAPAAGHLGAKKTLGRLRDRFYWRGCDRDVRRWCRQCDLCSSRKGPSKRPRAPMKAYNVGAPLERIAIDITGPLPKTDAGNRYVLVVADYFTKWTEAYAIPDQEAGTVAKKLVEEFVARYGVPREIHSDQGRNFESALFQEVCRLLDLDKTRTTPLRPQSDGMVERFNRTLKSMLSLFVHENQRDWDRHLPLLLMAYRSAVHETTGCTPSEMMFGRELRLPVDLLYGCPGAVERPTEPNDYADRLRDQLAIVHQYARDHLKLESDRQKLSYDHRLCSRVFNPGQAVWFYNPRRRVGFSPCLQRSWEGPYVVIKRISDVVYRIQKSATAKPRVVHHDRLRPYEGRDEPTWYRDTAPPSVDSTETGPENGPDCPTAAETDGVDKSPAPDRKRPQRATRPPAWTTDFVID